MWESQVRKCYPLDMRSMSRDGAILFGCFVCAVCQRQRNVDQVTSLWLQPMHGSFPGQTGAAIYCWHMDCHLCVGGGVGDIDRAFVSRKDSSASCYAPHPM